MKITFIGATHEVTGSCYYLEAAGHKFLVDCGMEQGPDYYENAEIPVALGEIEFVLLTHAPAQSQKIGTADIPVIFWLEIFHHGKNIMNSFILNCRDQ